ncbi:MAG: fused MFS/spermidine synthase [Elusimicrobia bacterium]|nr:fused MFS/spermidine synthase [Elusimicrobiota bacterium]
MILEILGARLFGPHFGVSLYIWSALITVTLMALALGYWWGGCMADKKPDTNRLYLFIFLAGIFILAIPLFSPVLIRALGFLEIRTSMLICAIILFGPPLVLLGMVTPYAVKLATPDLGVLGNRTGCLYAVSTAGSCFGALLSGFFLIPLFGVGRVFYFLSLALFLLWPAHLFLFGKHKVFRSFHKSFFALFSLLAVLILSLSQPRNLFSLKGASFIYEANSLYGHIGVMDMGDNRWLTIDGIPNSGIDKRSGFSIYGYTYYFELMNYIHPEARNALVVGLGAGSVSKRFMDYGLSVDSVEIDPKVAEAAKKYFEFKTGKGNLYIKDGRRYIGAATKKYDFAVLDAASGDLLPGHLFSLESFRDISRALKDNGILGVNYVGFGAGKNSRPSCSIYLTLREIFPYVKVYMHKSRGELGNIIFLASPEPLKLRRSPETCDIPEIRKILVEMAEREIDYRDKTGKCGGIVLTDDYNPIQSWNLKAALKWRENVRNIEL